jgi:hypothetical protein
MPALTAGQIQAQVSAIRKRIKNGAHSFAIFTTEAWDGPDRLQIDGIEHLVMPCVSDLQAREALLRAGEEKKPAVLLCAVSSDKLGDDVIARLAKRRVFAPQPLDILTELFSARIVDPRVLSTKALVEALLDRVPLTGYKPAAGGALDLQQAWQALLEQVLGVSIDGPSLSQLLEWSLDPTKIKALADLNPQLKQSFVDWFARTRGESIRFMMAAIDASIGADLIPLGLTLGLVFSPELQKESEYHAARGRLEKYFGGKDIDPESAGAWFRAAEGVVLPLLEEPDVLSLRGLLKGVDALLADLKLQGFAYLSNYSPAGLAGRFDRLGKALQEAVKAKSSANLDQVRICLAHIGQHTLSPVESDRQDRAEMAFRLIRWLKTTTMPDATAIFPDLMDFYHRDGGFLDWARNRLRETDVSGPMQAAFQQILQRVDERLVPLEKRFAEKLADWTKAEQQSSRLICIEDVLSKVVVPASKGQPVLLLVLDGMNAAVFRQLVRDIERQAWTEIANDGLGVPRPVLATLPSVTQISRRALFLGRLDPSKSGTEQGEFSGNDFLLQASGSQVRPKLFLKGDLQEQGYGGLAPEVRAALADKKCRVVAVVVNAIDDHLDSGDQVVFTWGMDRIKPLRELLKLAAEAGRLVLMTSDHGHVLDFGTRQLNATRGDAGDRYRMDTDSIEDGEIVFEGARVEKAAGQKKVTLAWSSDVRYAAQKRGYHGGANPQEMMIPFAILSGPNAMPASGWEEVPPYEPDWWRTTGGEAAVKVTGPEGKRQRQEDVDAVKGLDLFEQAKAKKDEASQAWVDALLQSKVYLEQLKLAVRGAPPREVITTLITTIDARGGSIMKPALAQALGVPLFRVDGLVQNISRILNVDGYEILSFDRNAETITLNAKLLKAQFEIE